MLTDKHTQRHTFLYIWKQKWHAMCFLHAILQSFQVLSKVKYTCDEQACSSADPKLLQTALTIWGSKQAIPNPWVTCGLNQNSPIVGIVVTTSPNFNLYKIVVFPAASRPTKMVNEKLSLKYISYLIFTKLNKLSSIRQVINKST